MNRYPSRLEETGRRNGSSATDRKARVLEEDRKRKWLFYDAYIWLLSIDDYHTLFIMIQYNNKIVNSIIKIIPQISIKKLSTFTYLSKSSKNRWQISLTVVL